MNDLDFFKVLSIVSPFVSAIFAGLLTYFFTLKTKRFEILYQNKIPAFKEISTKLVELKKFCWGRIDFLKGHEFSPYYNEGYGALQLRTDIANSSEFNSIFLSQASQAAIENLINELSGLCNAELSMASGQDLPGIEKEYLRISQLTETCISTLYKDLNLK